MHRTLGSLPGLDMCPLSHPQPACWHLFAAEQDQDVPEHILGAGAGNGTRQLLDLLLSLSPSWPKHLPGAFQSGVMPPENNKIRSTYEIKIYFSTLTPHTSPPHLAQQKPYGCWMLQAGSSSSSTAAPEGWEQQAQLNPLCHHMLNSTAAPGADSPRRAETHMVKMFAELLHVSHGLLVRSHCFPAEFLVKSSVLALQAVCYKCYHGANQ